ncbi:MAG: hypothetical protein FJZ01_26525 [Candidatus Sericytochromatia bacterium]|nr:hypothetical protein [Candidatus Tanganyikabacteria bacterium]
MEQQPRAKAIVFPLWPGRVGIRFDQPAKYVWKTRLDFVPETVWFDVDRDCWVFPDSPTRLEYIRVLLSGVGVDLVLSTGQEAGTASGRREGADGTRRDQKDGEVARSGETPNHD